MPLSNQLKCYWLAYLSLALLLNRLFSSFCALVSLVGSDRFFFALWDNFSSLIQPALLCLVILSLVLEPEVAPSRLVRMLSVSLQQGKAIVAKGSFISIIFSVSVIGYAYNNKIHKYYIQQ